VTPTTSASDSNSAPVPKILNLDLGSKNIQISEDSSSFLEYYRSVY